MIRNTTSALLLTLVLHTPSAGAKPPVEASPPLGRPVSLRTVLEFATRNSPELGVAASRVARARAAVEAERVPLPSDPVVSAGVALRRDRSRSSVDYQVGVSQELDLAGKRNTRIRARRAELTAEQQGSDLTLWHIHQQVHALYHRAVVARERVLAAERFVEFGTRVLAVAEERLRAGETSPLPVRLAETEVAQAKQSLLAARSAYRATQLALAQVSGWSLRDLPEPSEGLDSPRPIPGVDQLLQLAARSDPGLRAARARSDAARVELASAERDAWPNPTVGVHYLRESDPWGSPAHVVGGTLSFPLPVWRGAEPSRLRARANLDQARAEAKREEALLEGQVRQAALAVEASSERVRLFGKEILPNSQDNLNLIERAFALGEIDMTEVLVARERFLRVQESALDAFDDYYQALAALEAALGVELERSTSHTHPGVAGQLP